MTTFTRLPFSDSQQLEIGGEALAAFERRTVAMEADVYQVLAQWMVEVLKRIDSSTLRELSASAETPLATLAQNALQERGDACCYWTPLTHSAWLRLRARWGIRRTW